MQRILLVYSHALMIGGCSCSTHVPGLHQKAELLRRLLDKAAVCRTDLAPMVLPRSQQAQRLHWRRGNGDSTQISTPWVGRDVCKVRRVRTSNPTVDGRKRAE